MLFQKYIFTLIFALFTAFFLNAQQFGFKRILKKEADRQMPFAVKNTPNNRTFLEHNKVNIKNTTRQWLYITASPKWVSNQLKKGNITDFYFEYAPPHLLDDTARFLQNVNSVYNGDYPLRSGYTGKGVIVGIVDGGLDYTHPDFITPDGENRVIRYWDQSEDHPTQSPQPYGYGQIWYHQQLQNKEKDYHVDDFGHGTTVTGICAGNGLADGKNRGMAPQAKIIFVQSDFSLPNWTLTVADACDYIFRVADSLGMPAVVNLSLGAYLGSHDGKDPAAVLMNQLVTEKSGRIIVGAAGNGAAYGKYHAHASMSLSDTNFIWLKTNPDSQLGDSTVFFDLWTAVDSAKFRYSFGVNRPGPSFEDCAATPFRFAQLNVGVPHFDTLRNANGDVLATLEVYTEYMNGDFHLQGFFSHVDSIDYLYRFSTTGLGSYDLWSGDKLALNRLVDTIPSPSVYPPIVNYVAPDSMQTIISSWNCSPKIVSVGNFRCRLGYIDHNGDYEHPGDSTITSGELALSSSWGPTRDGRIKPDISASGEISFGSAPYYIRTNPGYNKKLSQSGWYLVNGGTSMASPIVAGIAALYLERCPKSTSQDFLNDIMATADLDNFTGAVPNVKYGYGKINAFKLLTSKNQTVSVLGDTTICQSPIALSGNAGLYDFHWSNQRSQNTIFVSQPDTLFYWARETSQGCKEYSDTVIITQESSLSNPDLYQEEDSLYTDPLANYQWYKNGHPLTGAIASYYIPSTTGWYCVAVQNPNGYCRSFSRSVYWEKPPPAPTQIPPTETVVYPNPAHQIITVEKSGKVPYKLKIVDITGKTVLDKTIHDAVIKIDLRMLAAGTYFVKVGEKVFQILKI